MVEAGDFQQSVGQAGEPADQLEGIFDLSESVDYVTKIEDKFEYRRLLFPKKGIIQQVQSGETIDAQRKKDIVEPLIVDEKMVARA